VARVAIGTVTAPGVFHEPVYLVLCKVAAVVDFQQVFLEVHPGLPDSLMGLEALLKFFRTADAIERGKTDLSVV
jgi:hypothetical protein